MTKSEIAERIAEDSGITRKQADAALDSMLRTITETLGRGGRVDLADFGTFSVAERSARTGRNPATGEVIEIPAKRYTRFRAGKALMEAVDRGSS
ncbi:MAG: DNA-binding protein HU [Gemmatimonadales bacterium]|nr:DNA-binding protein HU [Gemmatimonadales bacterium]